MLVQQVIERGRRRGGGREGKGEAEETAKKKSWGGHRGKSL